MGRSTRPVGECTLSLENQYIDESYKDVVQLEQSGAGLPSHGGAPARIFDGAGNQICGQTNCLNPFDHDPITIADGTFEWLEDMTKAELESAGWTFPGTNAEAEVKNGNLIVYQINQDTTNGTLVAYYTFDTAITGEFCFHNIGGSYPYHPSTATYKPCRYFDTGFFVGNTGTPGECYGANTEIVTTAMKEMIPQTSWAWNTWDAKTKTWDSTSIYHQQYAKFGISRDSSDNVLVGAGNLGASVIDPSNAGSYSLSGVGGWYDLNLFASVTTTFQVVGFYRRGGYAGYSVHGPLRRYA